MSVTISVAGSAVAWDVAATGLSLTTRADRGDAGFGGIPVDDVTAAFATTGHKLVAVEESGCAQPRLFTGYVTDRDVSRSLDRGMFVGTAAREVDVSIVDLNAILGFRLFHDNGANRPAETLGARLAWLIAQPELTDYIDNFSFCGSALPGTALGMDEADYRGQPPSAVLADIAARPWVGYTGDDLIYFAFWDPTSAEVALFLNTFDASTYDSTLSISNDDADVDFATTFAPLTEAKLKRSPEEVYSGVLLTYNRGSSKLYRRRDSTAVAFLSRDFAVDLPYTGKLTTAQSQAEALLTAHSTERDVITCTLRLPRSKVGLIQAGHRIAVKFTHLPDYDDWVSMRVVTYTPKAIDDSGAQWDVELELVAPAEQGGGPEPCPDPTPAGSYWPMGSGTSDADGLVIYAAPGAPAPDPPVPSPGHAGNWNFPVYGAGGPGTTDLAGYAAANKIYCVVVGAGTMAITTAGSAAKGLQAHLYHTPAGDSEKVEDEDQTGHAGDTFTFTVPSDGFCNHWIEIYETDGAAYQFGFAGMTWTAGEVDHESDAGPGPLSSPSNPSGTAAPTPSDDQSAGYRIGSHWIDTVTDTGYLLVDDTIGSAVWAIDTVLPGTAVGDVLTWTGSLWVGDAPAGGDLTLDDLTDVDAPSPAVGDLIQWDGSAWVNVTREAVAPLFADDASGPLLNEAGDGWVYPDL